MKEKLELHKKWLNGEEDGVKLNLRGADLRGADLRDADLRGADLSGAIGNNNEVKTLQLGTYIVVLHKDIISIGCQTHLIGQWENFDNMVISNMDTKALKWWKENKNIVLTLAKREVEK